MKNEVKKTKRIHPKEEFEDACRALSKEDCIGFYDDVGVKKVLEGNPTEKGLEEKLDLIEQQWQSHFQKMMKTKPEWFNSLVFGTPEEKQNAASFFETDNTFLELKKSKNCYWTAWWLLYGDIF